MESLYLVENKPPRPSAEPICPPERGAVTRQARSLPALRLQWLPITCGP
jgi:hypothetical protein